MLDNFKIDQPIAYKTIKNAIENNKYSHAYLIESNGYSHTFDFAVAFAKSLLKDNNDILELKVIEPDGAWIKKEQIDELQSIFSEKALLGDKKVYIINGVEKMKEATSNSLLKFLEEPEEGIIAILITDNSYQIPITIISRCQILSLIKSNEELNKNTKIALAKHLYNKTEEINEYIENPDTDINIEKVLDFILNIEKNKINSILYTKNLVHKNFKDRKEINELFEIMMLFYKDVLNIKINRPIEYFMDYNEELKNVESKNTKELLTKKINVIETLKEKIKFNVNIGLLIDKLIIEMDRCYND